MVSNALLLIVVVVVVVVVVPVWALGIRPRVVARANRRELEEQAQAEWDYEMREASSYVEEAVWPSCSGCGAPARGSRARWCWKCSKSL